MDHCARPILAVRSVLAKEEITRQDQAKITRWKKYHTYIPCMVQPEHLSWTYYTALYEAKRLENQDHGNKIFIALLTSVAFLHFPEKFTNLGLLFKSLLQWLDCSISLSVGSAWKLQILLSIVDIKVRKFCLSLYVHLAVQNHWFFNQHSISKT